MSRASRSPQRNPQPSRSPQPSPQRPPQGGQQRPPQQSGGGSQRPSQSQDKIKQHQLHFLFDRPGEPVFLPKGDENAVFDVPTEYIVSNQFFN